MLTLEKVAGLLQALRNRTEKGELQWRPFEKENKAGKAVVGFRADLENGTVVKIKSVVGEKKSLTIKAKVRRDLSDDESQALSIRVASMKSTPSLKKEMLELAGAVTLSIRKIPEWAEEALFAELPFD